MADPKDKSEDEGTIVEKEELVEFLTSSSKVRRGLAESIYDQGLNTWELLVDGDEEYFTSFKGVGKKTAQELIIIGGRKKEELSKPPEPARDIRDVLSEVPRVNQGVIDNLIDAGFNDVYRVSAVDPSELREVQGVGPKLSEKIVEACREEAEAHPQSVAGVEEAMPMPVDEEAPAEKGEGFLSKLIGKVKAFFSTEKEAPPESEPEVEETPEEEEKEPEEAPPEEESSEKEAEEEKPSEEKPSEGEKEPEPEETVEEKTEEEPEPAEQEEASSDEEQAAEDETPTDDKEAESGEQEESSEEGETPDEEPPKEEPRSIWSKIKGIFSKKEEEAPSEEKDEGSEEKPSKETEKEGDSAEGEPDEDRETSEEKGSEEEPSEEKGSSDEEPPKDEEPAEEKPSKDKEEPSEEKPAEEDEEPKLEIEDIHHIPGVDKKTADLLLSSGYVNLDELREAVPEDLMMIEGIDEDTAKFIYEVLRK